MVSDALSAIFWSTKEPYPGVYGVWPYVALSDGDYVASALAADDVLNAPKHVFWADEDFSSNITVREWDEPPYPATVTTLATVQAEPLHMAVANGLVFWTASDGSVSSIAEGGGTVTSLATGQGVPGSIVIDAAYAYWVDQTDGTLVRRAYTGQGPLTTLAAFGANGPLAADGAYLYWPVGTDIWRVAKTGGSATAVCASCIALGLIRAIALSGTSVYFTDQDGALYEVPSSGGTVTTIVDSNFAVGAVGPIYGDRNGIAVDTLQSYVYWTASTGLWHVALN